jgi:sortase B
VELNDYLTNIKAIAHYYDEENAPVFGDEIITLSTCDYYTNDGRLALLAKRIGGDHE